MRPRLTSRAAILAIVVCAIALSLAYPVREYIAQRRQLAALEAQHRHAVDQLRRLEARRAELDDPETIKDEARRLLHYCMPDEKCWVVLDPPREDSAAGAAPARRDPWYATLWRSVERADRP